MKKILFSILALLSYSLHAQIITTIAGSNNTDLGDGGLAINASLDGPIGVALDNRGNYYIADTYHNRIRKVNAEGIITTIAGNDTTTYNGDGIQSTIAHLLRPAGITCDYIGNVYFADALHNRVRKIDTSGIITTIAGNGIGGYNGDNILAISAEVNNPSYVALDAKGNVYITDMENSRIRKVNSFGIITTIAGTGIAGFTGNNDSAITAEINHPYGIVIDNAGNIYFSDYDENVVRKIDTIGIITTFAGGKGLSSPLGDNASADSARLATPAGLGIDKSGNIYIADADDYRIRMVSATSGIITTIAGNGLQGYSGDNDLAINARLNTPGTVTIDSLGNFYISDFNNNRIRYIKNASIVNNLNNTQITISAYPNPCSGKLTVNITSSIHEKIQITIANALGERIKEINTYTNQSTIIQLHQPAGIYYLHAVTAHGIETKIISIIK